MALYPLEYTAISMRKEFPEAALVFIGPCVDGCSSLATSKAAVRQLKKLVETEAATINVCYPDAPVCG